MDKVEDQAMCACGSIKIKRLMGAPLFKLRGNGWPGKEMKAASDCKKMADGKTI